jgi:phage terminase, small subunit
MAKKGKLTEKQQRFVDEYLIDLNATQAAIRAGYSVKTADVIGCENLTKPNIQQAIAEHMAERSRRTGVNQDRVVLELAKIACHLVQMTSMQHISMGMKKGMYFATMVQYMNIQHQIRMLILQFMI